MERKKRPGYLTQYAVHAGISKQAAAEQLKRVGVNYLEPFEFGAADKLRLAMRHADREPFAKPIYVQPGESPTDPPAGEECEPDSATDPAFAKMQARREYFRAEVARLDYEERIGTLVEKAMVEEEAFRLGRLVRDAVLNVPARLAGILAAENDQRRVHDLLEKELRQVIEVLAIEDEQTGGAAAT